jgi:hypothetical protein
VEVRGNSTVQDAEAARNNARNAQAVADDPEGAARTEARARGGAVVTERTPESVDRARDGVERVQTVSADPGAAAAAEVRREARDVAAEKLGTTSVSATASVSTPKPDDDPTT